MSDSKCKKCGGVNISGPRYDRAVDRLRYSCRTCGYGWSERTADKESVADFFKAR